METIRGVFKEKQDILMSDYIIHPLMPIFLITLLEGRLMTTEAIKKSKFPQGTFYSSRIKDKLIDLDLIKETEKVEGKSKVKYLELTERGNTMAVRFIYCFDHSIEVIALPPQLKEQLLDLQQKQHNKDSLEEFCLSLLQSFI